MVAANGIPSPSPAIKGFTIVTTGKINKIVAVKNAKESSLPIVTEAQLPTEQ